MRLLGLPVALALSLHLSTPAAADVLEVSPTHPDNLQAVIDVSAPGDVILVQPGDYGPITISHGLTLIARADGVRVGANPYLSTSEPCIRLDGPGTGVVRLAGIEAVRVGNMSTWVGHVVVGGGFDRLELLDCELLNYNSFSGGLFYPQVGVLVFVPVTYVAESDLRGSETNHEYYDCCDDPGAPAFSGPRLISRGSRFTGGPAGNDMLYAQPNPLSPGWGPGCVGFDLALDGQQGCAAVSTGIYVGQGDELIGGRGGEYYCCSGSYGSGIDPCEDGTFTLLGFGPSGPALSLPGAALEVAHNLDGPARVQLGDLYTLAAEGGAAGGVLLLSRELAAPVDVPGFGPLMLVDPLFAGSLPPGPSTHGFVVPWTLGLIGEAVAFQAWTADAGLGVPVLTVIEP